jgi:isoaspartyl peptidase/L-asparaginase-like protein (Ntn-hydrolase superfamily)
MLLRGDSLSQASRAALDTVSHAGGLGGAICVSSQGEIAMPLTDARMGRAWRAAGDDVRSALAG